MLQTAWRGLLLGCWELIPNEGVPISTNLSGHQLPWTMTSSDLITSNAKVIHIMTRCSSALLFAKGSSLIKIYNAS